MNVAVDRPDLYQPKDCEWFASFVDDTRNGFWSVGNDNWEGEDLVTFPPDARDAAVFAVDLLNEDALGDTSKMETLDIADALDDAMKVVECKVCEKPFYSIQLHDQRCPADLS